MMGTFLTAILGFIAGFFVRSLRRDRATAHPGPPPATADAATELTLLRSDLTDRFAALRRELEGDVPLPMDTLDATEIDHFIVALMAAKVRKVEHATADALRPRFGELGRAIAGGDSEQSKLQYDELKRLLERLLETDLG